MLNIARNTGENIIAPIVESVAYNTPYTVNNNVNIPSYYRFVEVVGETTGVVTDPVVEVIYYYEKINHSADCVFLHSQRSRGLSEEHSHDSNST